jgi:hypothetical protein
LTQHVLLRLAHRLMRQTASALMVLHRVRLNNFTLYMHNVSKKRLRLNNRIIHHEFTSPADRNINDSQKILITLSTNNVDCAN